MENQASVVGKQTTGGIGIQLSKTNIIAYCNEEKYYISSILLLHVDGGSENEEGHGAAMLSFRSQMKLTPEVLSNVASVGRLGRRQPYSKTKKEKSNFKGM